MDSINSLKALHKFVQSQQRYEVFVEEINFISFSRFSESFIEVRKFLLATENARFLLSEKFCQDPLKEHFGAQRRSGRCNENPNLLQFQNQEQRLNVMGSPLMADMRGKTRGRDLFHPVINVNDTKELPKKRKKDNVF